MEKWIKVKGCPKYECSTEGQFRSCPRIVNGKNGKKRPFSKPNLILKQRKAKDGWKVTMENSDGFRRTFRSENVIAETFLNRNVAHFVYHKDENVHNNKVDNLLVKSIYQRYKLNSKNSKEIIGYPNYILAKKGIVISKLTGMPVALFYGIANKCWSVKLWRNNKEKTYNLYRLLAIHFIPNPYNLPEVHHKDYDRMNHSLNNLKWVTGSENMKDSFKNGNTKGCFQKGSKHEGCKLTKKDILEIRKLRRNGKKLREIAPLFNITDHHVSQVCRVKQNIEHE